MRPRERVVNAINFQPVDRVPIDLGSTFTTGIYGGTYGKLKKQLGLGDPDTYIYEPFQMLAEPDEAFREHFGIDTIGLHPPRNMFGVPNMNAGHSDFELQDGSIVKMAEGMEFDRLPSGDVLTYPCGDRSCKPSGRMVAGTGFFDAIIRQDPDFDIDSFDPERFAAQTFLEYTDEECRYLEERSRQLCEGTDYAVMGEFLGASFSRMTEILGSYIREPYGIRNPEEWFVRMLTHPEKIEAVHDLQFQICMKNLERYRQAVGDRIQVIVLSGTDFGSQNGPLISPQLYREMIKPLHAEIHDWIHENTTWKTMFHSCGSVVDFMDDFCDVGLDILNPIQISAAGMDPQELKDGYGGRLVFWGGGVDTQKILPFVSPEDVRGHVAGLVEVFSRGSGFVFAPVHNIQDKVPVENIIAMFEAVRNRSLA